MQINANVVFHCSDGVTWVVLPEPVSPQSRQTSLPVMASMVSCSMPRTGNPARASCMCSRRCTVTILVGPAWAWDARLSCTACQRDEPPAAVQSTSPTPESNVCGLPAVHDGHAACWYRPKSQACPYCRACLGEEGTLHLRGMCM